MSAEAPSPSYVGKATLTSADGAALVAASNVRFGYFSQPRLLLYSAVFSFMAAVFAFTGRGLAAEPLLVLALICFVLAIWAGNRTARMLSASWGRGQEREVALDDDGLTVREPGLTITYAWSRFERVITLPEHLALISGPGVIIIVKRAFDDATFARVRALIAAKVPAPEPR